MSRARQIHCIIDCYAEVLDRRGIDCRPLYVGVWDAYFEEDGERISYSSVRDDPKDWHARVGRLFGMYPVLWQSRAMTGGEGFRRLVEPLTSRPGRSVGILKVDLFHMPHVPQYRKKHSPHGVVVEAGRSEGAVRVVDPYFSWEGEVGAEQLADAFDSGFLVDPDEAREADVPTAWALFAEDGQTPSVRLTAAVEGVVCRAVERSGGKVPADLFDAVQEAGVVAKRIGAYRPVLEWLSDVARVDLQADLPTEDDLRKGWENLMLMIARSGLLQRRFDCEAFRRKLVELDEAERRMKQALADAFDEWARRQSPAHVRTGGAIGDE